MIYARLAIAIVVGLTLALPGQSTPVTEVMNDTCPVMEGEPVGENPVVVEYEGHKINLCCKKCKRVFFQEPQRYIKGLPQFATAAATAAVATAPPPVLTELVASAESTPLLDWLGRFHVVVVHFPIALILLAAAWEWLLALRGRAPCAPGLRKVLACGVAAAAVAITLGLLYEETMEFVGQRGEVFEQHELFAWIGSACAAAALALSSRATRSALVKWNYRGLLLLAAIFIGLAGHAGGRLTQGLSFFSRG